MCPKSHSWGQGWEPGLDHRVFWLHSHTQQIFTECLPRARNDWVPMHTFQDSFLGMGSGSLASCSETSTLPTAWLSDNVSAPPSPTPFPSEISAPSWDLQQCHSATPWTTMPWQEHPGAKAHYSRDHLGQFPWMRTGEPDIYMLSPTCTSNTPSQVDSTINSLTT